MAFTRRGSPKMLSLGGFCPQKERARAEGCSLGARISPSPIHTGVRESVVCPTLTRVAGEV